MQTIDNIKQAIKENIGQNLEIDLELPPDPKFGDYAFSCFTLAKILGKNPAEVATNLAKTIKSDLIVKTEAVGPYVNIFINKNNFLKIALADLADKNFTKINFGQNKKILLEYSGPNTNKPQHIGHLRNNCIGQSLVNIFKAVGYTVIPVNIINDRGIHIVKSMLSYQKWGNNETPKSSGLKGDHLVGKYYVRFGSELALEKKEYLAKNNIDLSKLDNLEQRKVEDEFLAQSPLMQEARTMLKDWEAGDKEVRKLWQLMNSWVYDGYKITYDRLGVKFDKQYFESQTYLLGKDLVKLGLDKNIFYKKSDGSILVDLRHDGLDEKIVQRADGTSVYITQDLGTAKARYDQYKFDQAIYVVASEQDYHFKVLFLTLQKLGFEWAKNLYHLSYGLVSLPEGRIKSREGKTADADDIMDEMHIKAKEKTTEQTAEIVALGAIKFFMLSTSPAKNIVYNAEKSISFDGYTGTFIQYTHARINSILNKANRTKLDKINKLDFNQDLSKEEISLAKILLAYPEILQKSASEYNPSILTQYLFDLAKIFNAFYQEKSVLQAETENLKNIRLHLCLFTKQTLKNGLELLGIQAPEAM